MRGLYKWLLVLPSITCASPAARASDYAWLEKQWVSDVQATRAANPWLQQLQDQPRADFMALFGRMRWQFADGLFTATPGDRAAAAPAPYFVRSAGSDQFELIIDDSPGQAVFLARRTQGGFCVRLTTSWAPELHAAVDIEPFVDECFRAL